MSRLLAELPAVNAVRVGRLYFKPAAVHAVLAESVRLVTHEHLYEGNSAFSVGGSCTLVSFRRRAYVVTTRHQLHVPKGEEPPQGHFETLRFATQKDGLLKNILVDRCFHESSNPDEEYHDLLFFGVQQDWLSESADRPYFFPIEEFSNSTRLVSFFYGHPVSRNEFQYEPYHVYVRTAYIDGMLDVDHVSNAEYLRRHSYPKSDYEMNGFSGGAVFSLFGSVDTEFRVALDGIIVLAGGGYLHAVDVNYLRRAIELFADE